MENILHLEYDNFMKWLKETHPETYEKYGRNISIPFQVGEGVSVTNNFKITHEEHDLLVKIAHSYYQLPPEATESE